MKWIEACSGAGAAFWRRPAPWPVRLLAAAAMAGAAWWTLAVACRGIAEWLPWAAGVPLAAWGVLLSLPVVFDGWRDNWLADYTRDAPFVWWRTLTNEGRGGVRLWHALVWSCTWPAEVVVCAGTILAVIIHCVIAAGLRRLGRILNARLTARRD